MRVALDTNILAYAEGVGDEARCQGARTLITELIHRDVVLPAQTLGELSRVLSAKSQRDPAGTRQAVLEWADCFFVAVNRYLYHTSGYWGGYKRRYFA